MLTDTITYKALVDKDVSFEGTFIAAVKTTGIFCRPTCTAKKPNKENVEFFKTTKEAILHGYRPCKICSPLEKLGETPKYIKDILKEINNNPSTKLKDWDLRTKGIEPGKLHGCSVSIQLLRKYKTVRRLLRWHLRQATNR
jgi:AraC family transcriptional regulator of adaptative response/methylated-DNA-[protein]-cysteine methyltransferase